VLAGIDRRRAVRVVSALGRELLREVIAFARRNLSVAKHGLVTTRAAYAKRDESRAENEQGEGRDAGNDDPAGTDRHAATEHIQINSVGVLEEHIGREAGRDRDEEQTDHNHDRASYPMKRQM
jgi:hypothetical protein